jgi:hypothetical protein
VRRAQDVVKRVDLFHSTSADRGRKGSQRAQGRHNDYNLTTTTAIACVRLLLLL